MPHVVFHLQKMSDRRKLSLLVFLCQFSYSDVLVTWFSISEYLHVSLIRSVRLFAPSIQWVPWPPQTSWPCSSRRGRALARAAVGRRVSDIHSFDTWSGFLIPP